MQKKGKPVRNKHDKNLRTDLCTCAWCCVHVFFRILYSIAHDLEGHTARREREAMGGDNTVRAHIGIMAF